MRRNLSSFAGLLGVFAALPLSAWPQAPQQELNREFQQAVAAYNAHDLSTAAARLEALLPRTANNFQVHELLGLVYAAESKDEAAVEQLAIAARLNPASGAVHANLATTLARAGHSAAAEKEFRRALTLEPDNAQANSSLAQLYLSSGKVGDAIPLLEKAHRLAPDSYDTTYNLAMACYLTDRLPEAHTLATGLLQQHNVGEVHNLLGRIEEKQGQAIEAVNEFATAAHMDPTEENLFAWGSELLLHRTYDAAIAVFQQATQRYPDSARLWTALGLALFARTRYPESVQALMTAADRSPHDPRCYLFLSKAYLMDPGSASQVIERFRRYAELEPKNGVAQYYYAMSLWKGQRADPSAIDLAQVQSLLEKAIALDDTLAPAHLQLGILYADHHEWEKALPQYTRAAALDPGLPDAHYRLGQYYTHAGDKQRAQQEFHLFQQLQASQMAEADRQRAAVRQFIVSSQPESQGGPAAAPAQP